MNAIKRLKIAFLWTDLANILNKSRSLEEIAMNESIIIGKYRLSIQAGIHAYCHPRINYEDMDMYSSVEIAIIRNKFISLSDLGFHKALSYENGDIYCFVPVELATEIYSYLLEYCSKG